MISKDKKRVKYDWQCQADIEFKACMAWYRDKILLFESFIWHVIQFEKLKLLHKSIYILQCLGSRNIVSSYLKPEKFQTQTN